ncbi:RNA-binding protein 7 [Takifugu flavidus]|uniref:RNA-binding protein 7 n=1 Tax=Takifugu flavidus TaxID=433684 RepID=A0A5C6PEW9_9TELE|nr:RNA-binding protein 7 [Takifugu flavidus]TWW77549.1 RNA-binding protein 7 [Takifugu flavidus]
MGIEEETDRTLFIRNLDPRVTEELLFELFLQAGPLVRTRIPKDSDGKQKSFGFAVYKHEVSVPYAMQLLDGIPLYRRNLHVQFRSGSSHGNNAQKSPTDSLDLHGQRNPVQFTSSPYTPPPLIQRSHSSPDNPQRNAAVNMMWQLHTQQVQQLNSGPSHQQRQLAGGKSVRAGSRQHHNTPYQHPASQKNSTGRNQHHNDGPGSSRHQEHSWAGYHQHKDRNTNRHHDNRGGSKHHDDWSNSRSFQDNRWRRY